MRHHVDPFAGSDISAERIKVAMTGGKITSPRVFNKYDDEASIMKTMLHSSLF